MSFVLNVADLNQVEIDVDKLASDGLEAQAGLMGHFEAEGVKFGIHLAFEYLASLNAKAAAPKP